MLNLDYKKGDAIVNITNTKLAAVMAAVNIPLRKDLPMIIKQMRSGEDLVTWCFHSQTEDGTITAKDVKEAWYNPDDFREKFPTHPITFAMDVLLNYSTMVDVAKQPNVRKMVGYAHPNGKSVIWVVAGSEKERACLARGLERTDDINNMEEVA